VQTRIWFIDFNPNWGTRFQHVKRTRLGPFSSNEIAVRVRDACILQRGYTKDTPLLSIYSVLMDATFTVRNSSGRILLDIKEI
jgi:hypothetical protein